MTFFLFLFWLPSCSAAVPFLTSSNSLASRHSANRQPPAASANNAATVPVFLQPPVAKFTAAQLYIHNI